MQGGHVDRKGRGMTCRLRWWAGLLLAGSCGTAAPAPAAPGPDADEQAVVAEANSFRRSQGVGPLRVQPQLQAAAAGFAAWMARTDRYGHEADGRQPAQRVEAQGYEHCLVAENIAFEYRSVPFEPGELPGRFMQGWIHSPGHRGNLLDAAAVDTGVGIARSGRSGRWYAVQLFGRPMSASVEFQVSNPSGRATSYRLDGRRYELPPRSTMTHRECVAPLLQGPTERVGERAQRVEGGQRYVLSPAPGGGWRLQRDTAGG
jgi:uncharacterized protein YkwD